LALDFREAGIPSKSLKKFTMQVVVSASFTLRNISFNLIIFINSIDAFLIRTMAYTTARVWGFCYFYDWINKDPRRTPRPDFYALAGISGGMLAGIATNPAEIVFARMQVNIIFIFFPNSMNFDR
jgi:hypothetical protein